MKLNSTQLQAVNVIDGPVMVIAGPGTGKTEIIANRIAKILENTDTPPDAILALTFTEIGAKAMRQRLLTTIGQTAYYVNITTFHSFCSNVMQEFPDKFIVSNELEPLSELERVDIFHQIITNQHFKFIKPHNQPLYYTSELIRAVQNLKREGISTRDFNLILANEKNSKQLNKNQELLKVFISYQKIIKDRGRYDFEDMINLVVKAFKKDQELLLTFQERLHYFLVDEYQDTNSSQNQVINLLASYWGDQANIFVVGDVNQSIYRFQGAALENTLEFKKTYPQAKIITLNQNYRSTQTILNSSFALIKNNHFQTVTEPLNSKLSSSKSQSGLKIEVAHLPQDIVENYWLAHKVKALIDQGVQPEEIAILYRHNQDAVELSDLFAKLNIPFNIEGGGDVLKDPTINKLLTLLKVINNSKDNLEDLDLFIILHYQFFKYKPLDILRLARTASKKKSNLIDTILSDKNNHLNSFIEKLVRWQQLNSEKIFSEFFEIVIRESGFLDWILNSKDVVVKLNRINSLFSEIKKLNHFNHQLNLDSFIKSLELMEINQLKIIENDLDIQTQSVTLSTAHKAKGKEWQYVFIYQAIDAKWGNNRSRQLIKLPFGVLKNTGQDIDKKEKNEDERRLFYVCMTRAKQKLYISYADRYTLGSYTKETLPTMFLTELPQKYLHPVNTKSIQSSTTLTELLTRPLNDQLHLDEKIFLKNLVTDFKLSPTALNTYLSCPYKFKLNNLIKVPKTKAGYMQFGSAIHKALELFYLQYIKIGKIPTKKKLLTQFKFALDKEVLQSSDYQTKLKQGQDMLSNYFDHYQSSFIKPLFAEKFFGKGRSKTFLNDIFLSGKIDRIEWLDKKKKTVKVIDYKTGKPKSRNDILGKTKSSEGDYYRQLVFYKLLSLLDKKFNYKVAELELDFIQTNDSAKFKKENFKIPDEDLETLKSTIIDTMGKIRDLKFSKTQKLSHCDRCEFQNHCWPEGLPKNI